VLLALKDDQSYSTLQKGLPSRRETRSMSKGAREKGQAQSLSIGLHLGDSPHCKLVFGFQLHQSWPTVVCRA